MNKTIIETLKRSIVRITYKDSMGSGVLFLLDTAKIVITAHHVMKNEAQIDENELCVERYCDGELRTVEFSLDEYIAFKTEDIALFKIETEENAESILFDIPDPDGCVILSGFPTVLSQSHDTKLYHLQGNVRSVETNKVYSVINERLGSVIAEEKDHIDGFSGGGLFAVYEDQLRLIGIETNVLTRDVAYNVVVSKSIRYIVNLLINQSSAFGLQAERINKNFDSTLKIRSSTLYRKNLYLISDIDSGLPQERITDEYRAGVDARPDHIRHNLDVVRNRRMNEISKYLSELPILLIRGASGQGKTTLALRYLMNSFNENQIIIVRNITSEERAVDIVHFLRSIVNHQDYVVFYDVSPGDRCWKSFLKEASSINTGIKILVAIREEDFNENRITRNEFSYNELHLWLTEEEAREIYEAYDSMNYTSFENAWMEFGGDGHLLEFTYILNHSESLQDKIKAQIQQIEEEEDSEEWFLILGIVAIAGKYNIKVPVTKLFEKVICRSRGKLLRKFIQELFIKYDNSGLYIECLHAVRAELILKALMEEVLFDYYQALACTISMVNSNVTFMVIDYLYQCGLNEEFINNISAIDYSSFITIEGILRGLLWYAVNHYLYVNKKSIQEGNKILNNQYLLLALSDITGLIKTNTSNNTLLDLLEENRPGTRYKIKSIVEAQQARYLDYSYVKEYMSRISDKVSKLINNSLIDGAAAAGYVLFWDSIFEINIPIGDVPQMRCMDAYELLHLIKGLNRQNCRPVLDDIKGLYEEKLLDYAGIISKYQHDNEVFANVIIDPTIDKLEIAGNKKLSFNDICMRAIHVLQILEPNASRYNVQLLGINQDNFDVPDTEKHIPSKNLYEKWITELNRIGLKLEEYIHAPMNWEDVYNGIVSYRHNSKALLLEIISVLDKYYKKGYADVDGLKKILLSWENVVPFAIPQCARDAYGIRDNYVDITDNNQQTEKKDTDNNQQTEKKDIVRNYRNKGFEDTVRQYANGVNGFIQAIYGVFDDLANRRIDTHNYRLAFYNIVSAFKFCTVFQDQFKDFFSDKQVEIDERNEYAVIQKTAALFRFIFLNGYKQQDNISYKANEELKRNLRKVDRYLDTGILEIPEVKFCNRVGRRITIGLYIEDYGKVLGSIYNTIKGLIGSTGKISIEEAYLVGTVDCLMLQMCDSNNTVLYCQSIPIINFASTDDFSRFKEYLLYTAERQNITPDKYTLADFSTSLLVMFNQVLQINQGISELENECINVKCKERINNSYKSVFNELKDSYLENPSVRNDTIIQLIEQMGKHDFISTNIDEVLEWTNDISSLLNEINKQVDRLSGDVESQ